MLKERLRAIINLVNNKNVVADIGCDHGFVCKALLKEERAKSVIACDISEGSLAKAKKLLKDFNNVQFRLCNGLEGLRNKEAEVIIIAGMGGYLITDILEENKSIALNATLLLLPHNNEHILREFLATNGFNIYDEYIIKEKRYYQLICAKKGVSDYTNKTYYYVGKRLFEKGEWEFINHKKESYKKLAQIAKQGKNSAKQGELYSYLEEDLCRLTKSEN